MASLKERHLAAVTSVAKHLDATVARGANARGVFLVTRRKRIPVNVVTIESRVPKGSPLKPPRLRFDRVVLRLLERLRTALQDAAPTGVTVVVTVTAPIRQWSKTATVMEEGIRALLVKRSKHAPLTDTIHGNEVRIRLMRGGGKSSTSRLAGFVHNRDSDPAILFDLAQTLLERTRKGLPGESWLVLAIEDEPAWLETYRHVCSQLFAQTDLYRVILVGANGAVSTPHS